MSNTDFQQDHAYQQTSNNLFCSHFLTPSQVRWFFKDNSTNKWTPFNGYDSIKIEQHYLKFFDPYTFRSVYSLDTHTLYNECEKHLLVRDGLFEVDLTKKLCYSVYWNGPDDPAPILRGTWFQYPDGPQCTPIEKESMIEQLELNHLQLLNSNDTAVQKNSSHSILGKNNSTTLNTSSSPQSNTGLEASVGEKNALITSLFSSPPKPPVLSTVRFDDCHVDWYSMDEIYMYAETTGFYIRQTLGMQKTGIKIGRGYFQEATLDDRPREVSHLCFVVHGMGQKMVKGSIVKSCDEIRATANRLLKDCLSHIDAAQKRVEFLPVQWRSTLLLDGNIVESLTLNNLTRFRYFLNSTFMDIMYYTSPLYRLEISQNLQQELNRLYKLFKERHPYFERNGGRVSIVSHSLGCVLAYDLLTGWVDPMSINMNAQPPINSVGDEPEYNSRQLMDTDIIRAKLECAKEVVQCLEFQLHKLHLNHNSEPNTTESKTKINANNRRTANHSLIFSSRLENLFCAGSPLAVYLTLRGIRPNALGNQNKIMPKSICRHMYNVFHPSDPVAYRLEPLILKRYMDIPPVEIYRHTDTEKIPYQTMHSRLPNLSSSPEISLSLKKVDYKDYEEFAGDMPKLSLPILPNEGSDQSLVTSGIRRNISIANFVFGLFRTPTEVEESTSCQPKRPLLSKRSRSTAHDNWSGTNDDNIGLIDKVDGRLVKEDETNKSSASSKDPSIKFDLLDCELDYRMDFQLPEGRYESSYLSALTVHTAYWTNPDFIMFILMQIFKPSAG